jgi:hypothetical protein
MFVRVREGMRCDAMRTTTDMSMWAVSYLFPFLFFNYLFFLLFFFPRLSTRDAGCVEWSIIIQYFKGLTVTVLSPSSAINVNSGFVNHTTSNECFE